MTIGVIVAVAIHPGTPRQVPPPPISGGAPAWVLASADFTDCPAGWVCLWEHSNYSGQMVAFSECCSWKNLSDVSFNNVMSSWRNRKAVDAKIADFAGGDGDRLCLNSWSSDGWIGATWNDRASSIKVFSSDTACN